MKTVTREYAASDFIELQGLQRLRNVFPVPRNARNVLSIVDDRLCFPHGLLGTKLQIGDAVSSTSLPTPITNIDTVPSCDKSTFTVLATSTRGCGAFVVKDGATEIAEEQLARWPDHVVRATCVDKSMGDWALVVLEPFGVCWLHALNTIETPSWKRPRVRPFPPHVRAFPPFTALPATPTSTSAPLPATSFPKRSITVEDATFGVHPRQLLMATPTGLVQWDMRQAWGPSPFFPSCAGSWTETLNDFADLGSYKVHAGLPRTAHFHAVERVSHFLYAATETSSMCLFDARRAAEPVETWFLPTVKSLPQKVNTQRAFRALMTGHVGKMTGQHGGKDVTAICAFSSSALMIAPCAVGDESSNSLTILPHFTQCVDGSNAILSSSTLGVTRGPIEGACIGDGSLYWMADHAIFSADIQLCAKRPRPTIDLPVRRGKMDYMVKRESSPTAARERLNALEIVDVPLSGMRRKTGTLKANQDALDDEDFLPTAIEASRGSDAQTSNLAVVDEQGKDEGWPGHGAELEGAGGQLTEEDIAKLEAIWTRQDEKYNIFLESPSITAPMPSSPSGPALPLQPLDDLSHPTVTNTAAPIAPDWSSLGLGEGCHQPMDFFASDFPTSHLTQRDDPHYMSDDAHEPEPGQFQPTRRRGPMLSPFQQLSQGSIASHSQPPEDSQTSDNFASSSQPPNEPAASSQPKRRTRGF
eukprot:GEMP01019840.1.p1 GENE.GEMP01019840.1~~GEMP01019840.1.p1  ORF type:complete len:700 (+),score=169.18 GEMP01019840.1:51-2150(+)